MLEAEKAATMSAADCHRERVEPKETVGSDAINSRR
jgi:hypothetical protein